MVAADPQHEEQHRDQDQWWECSEPGQDRHCDEGQPNEQEPVVGQPPSRSARSRRRQVGQQDGEILLRPGRIGRSNQLVEFLLCPSPHHPRSPISMARKRPRNKLDLRMPWLARIDQEAARRDRTSQSAKRLPNPIVLRKQFEEPGNNPNCRIETQQ